MTLLFPDLGHPTFTLSRLSRIYKLAIRVQTKLLMCLQWLGSSFLVTYDVCRVFCRPYVGELYNSRFLEISSV